MNGYVSHQDVAQAAGVCQSTVSRVLSGKADGARITPETRDRVRSVARQLGYLPGRNTRFQPRPVNGGEEQTAVTAPVAGWVIGLVISLASPASTLALIPCQEPGLAAAGFNVVMVTLPADPLLAQDRITTLTRSGVAGLLCCPSVYSTVTASAAGACPVTAISPWSAASLLKLMGVAGGKEVVELPIAELLRAEPVVVPVKPVVVSVPVIPVVAPVEPMVVTAGPLPDPVPVAVPEPEPVPVAEPPSQGTDYLLETPHPDPLTQGAREAETVAAPEAVEQIVAVPLPDPVPTPEPVIVTSPTPDPVVETAPPVPTPVEPEPTAETSPPVEPPQDPPPVVEEIPAPTPEPVVVVDPVVVESPSLSPVEAAPESAIPVVAPVEPVVVMEPVVVETAVLLPDPVPVAAPEPVPVTPPVVVAAPVPVAIPEPVAVV